MFFEEDEVDLFCMIEKRYKRLYIASENFTVLQIKTLHFIFHPHSG